MSLKSENEIIDFLFCPTAEDAFRGMKLQEMFYNIHYAVQLEQIEHTMQILWNACDEMEKFKEWKNRGVDNKCT